MKLSLIVNADTRPPNNRADNMFDGVRNTEVLLHGLINKRQVFREFDHELVVYIDEHERLDHDTLSTIRDLADCVTVRKHTERYRGHEQFGKSNDINFLHALSQARGEVVVHFDGDAFMFAKDKDSVQEWLDNLHYHRFVSYPSIHSPAPVEDASFHNAWWVSTRAFACRRGDLDITELEKCLFDNEYMWTKYGAPARKLGWLEHCLGLVGGHSVMYPPLDNHKLILGCWGTYHPGVFPLLNSQPFDKVHQYVAECGGLVYPNDLHAKPLP